MITLLDVDGVLADFHGGVLKLIKELFGYRLTIEDFKNWDYTSALESEQQKETLRKEITRPGFLASLEPYPGAEEAVAKLQRLGEVICVTSPNHAVPTWIPERYWWLEYLFKIPPKEVILTGKKHLIDGDIMVDDHPDNVHSWKCRHPRKKGLLWDRPYSKKANLPRVRSWDELIIRVINDRD